MSLLHSLLSLSLLVAVCYAQDPTWPTSCNLTHYPGKSPGVGIAYSTSTPDTEAECRGQCSGDARCGLYKWWTGQAWCELYQTSLQLMGRLLGVGEEQLMENDTSVNFGSKKCQDFAFDHSHCLAYPVSYELKHPAAEYEILHIFATTQLNVIQPELCQAACSTYSGCRSVEFRVDYWSWGCQLYNTTVTDLINVGREGEVVEETRVSWFNFRATYERFCGEQPYSTPEYVTEVPIQTTVPQLDCSDLSDLDGATLCLPIGHGDEATCQAIPGCCFLEVGGVMPFTMCIRTFGCRSN